MAVQPSRAFDFHSAFIDDMTAALADCKDLDDLVANAAEAGLVVYEDTAEDAPFDVEPDLIVYAEQDAQGIWILEHHE